MDERRVDLVERVLTYDGYFKIVRYRLRHSLFEGGMGPEITREVFDRGQAVAVLPYDPVTDQVVLIEQFRPGAYAIGTDPWLIETVAGIVEAGEDIEDVVRRETQEETGLHLQDLRPIARYFATPGGSSETVDLFLGRVQAADAGGIFGLASEGEDIKVHALNFRAAMDWLQQDKIKVATTIIALQWLSLHRRDIRDQWTILP